MNLLFVDCPTGLAGDMLMAGLLDLGVPINVIEEPLFALGLKGKFAIDVQEGKSFGLRGKKFTIEILVSEPPSRRWKEIEERINTSALAMSLKKKVLMVFQSLAEAEASVHGTTLEEVHFHEIASLDTLIEIVGVCAAVEFINPTKIVCSPPPTGEGMVLTKHGLLPIPVPVVLELARKYQITFKGGDNQPKAELTTPTGLALMAVLANTFEKPEHFSIKGVGIGLGNKSFDRPNLLRLCNLNSVDHQVTNQSENNGLKWQPLIFQEAWIDDASPEDLTSFADSLRELGAIEVVMHPVQMKKGRQGTSIKSIVTPENSEALRIVWLSKGTTIGFREYSGGRWVLARRIGSLSTKFGTLSAKQVLRPNDKLTLKIEHKDLKSISKETGRSIEEIRQEIFSSSIDFEPKEDWSW